MGTHLGGNGEIGKLVAAKSDTEPVFAVAVCGRGIDVTKPDVVRLLEGTGADFISIGNTVDYPAKPGGP